MSPVPEIAERLFSGKYSSMSKNSDFLPKVFLYPIMGEPQCTALNSVPPKASFLKIIEEKEPC